MNQTMLKMLRTLEEDVKDKWHEHINKLMFAYNATTHESTGYSPYFLMFGREPTLPLDTILNTANEKEKKSYLKFAQDWKDQMAEAYKVAFQRSSKRKEADRLRWEKSPLLSQLKCGDRVLVKNVKERGGPGKLRSYWEQNVYVIKEVKEPAGVVYGIQLET